MLKLDFPGGSVENILPTNAGDARYAGSIPGSGKSPGGGNGNALQYSCPENPMDMSLAGHSAQGYKDSNTTEHAHTHSVKLGFDPISDTEFYLK